MDNSFRLFPDAASTAAPLVDRLYFFLLAIATFFTLIIFVAIVYFVLKYRHGAACRSDEPARRLALETRSVLVGDSAGADDGDFLLGSGPVLSSASATGTKHGSKRGGQAMDVAHSACQRQARDQRPARAGRPARAIDDDFRGRDSQLLRAGVSPETGRAAGQLHHAVVRAEQDRAASICSAPSTAARATPK